MPENEDLYEILQVHPSAHPDVIQAAYRRLALLYHPDRNPSPEAAEMMKRLNHAYEILSDPDRRAAYDRTRSAQSRQRAEAPSRDTYNERPSTSRPTSQSGTTREQPRTNRPTPQSGTPTWSTAPGGMRVYEKAVGVVVLAVVIAIVVAAIVAVVGNGGDGGDSGSVAVPPPMPTLVQWNNLDSNLKPRSPTARSTDATSPANSGGLSTAIIIVIVMAPLSALAAATGALLWLSRRGGGEAWQPTSVGENYFTRGSSQDEVMHVQGTPNKTTTYQASKKEIWSYGYSQVTFLLPDGKVIEWDNSSNNLKVCLFPQSGNSTTPGHFTHGSTQDDVLHVQGTPTKIEAYSALKEETWSYGSSWITFSLPDGRVTKWHDRGNLKIR